MKVRNITLTICLLTACAWCFTLVSRVDSAEPKAPPAAFKPVASVEGLMHGQLLVFQKIGELVANKNAPKRTEQIHAFAEVLAELANINTLNSDKIDYRRWAGQLRDTSLKLAAAAERNADEAEMNKLITTIKGTCQSCHDVYQ